MTRAHAVYGSLGYAARRVPEISDDLVSIDRATRWGFSYALGPFELGSFALCGAQDDTECAKPAGVEERGNQYRNSRKSCATNSQDSNTCAASRPGTSKARRWCAFWACR